MPVPNLLLLRLPFLIACAAALAGPAAAQYKVVGPDGRITYTDRPPTSDAASRIVPMRAGTAAPEGPVLLPLELRQAVARFPVTLYTAAECAPCEQARRMLRTRGIPHAERTIADDADGEALQRISGGRAVPTLAVGSQVMRGFAEADWHSTLDFAGYPRESKLPRNYSFAAATPLSGRKPVPAAEPVPAEPPAREESRAREATPPPASRPGPAIRF